MGWRFGAAPAEIGDHFVEEFTQFPAEEQHGDCSEEHSQFSSAEACHTATYQSYASIGVCVPVGRDEIRSIPLSWQEFVKFAARALSLAIRSATPIM